MYRSYFEYSVSRPYPFRWFTPVVIIGGSIAIVLVTLINFVSTNYTLVARYTNDPNATISATTLYHWPSFLAAKLQPTCEPTNIPIGTRLTTNNSALTYTLMSVLQEAEEASQVLSPALVYHNNVLPSCSIGSISLQLEYLGRTAAQIALIPWGVNVQAFITCNLDTDNQRATRFNLTAEYDFIPASVSIYSGFYTFVGRNVTSKASLYWGESLLNMYWLKLASDLNNVRIQVQGQRAVSGTVVYTMNGSTTDLTSITFFNVLWRFVTPDVDNTHLIYGGEHQPLLGNSTYEMTNSADILAKSMYSTVLTDLGQYTATPNILTDVTLLGHFTANFSGIFQSDNRAGPAQSTYVPGQGGPLVTAPSVFATFYLCQVPQRRSPGAVILAILIADLVFLRALWTLWKLAANTYLHQGDRSTKFCEGCFVEENQNLLPHSAQLMSRSVRSRKGPAYELLPVGSYEALAGSSQNADHHLHHSGTPSANQGSQKATL